MREALEKDYVRSVFEVDHIYEQPHLEDFHQIDELEVRPPEVVMYFVRPKETAVQAFMADNMHIFIVFKWCFISCMIKNHLLFNPV